MGRLISCAFVLAVIALALQLAGVFDTPSAFQVVVQPNARWCVQRNQGSFAQIGDAFKEVKGRLTALSGRQRFTRGVGLYLDNPAEVEEAKVRWYAGFECSELAIIELDGLAKREAREGKPIQVLTIASTPVLETTMPWRHMLSPVLAASRAWPALKRYVADFGYETFGPAVEFYDADQADNILTIRYIMPLADVVLSQLDPNDRQ